MTAAGAPPVLDPRLLEILRDPQDRSALALVEESGEWFLEGGSGNRYPITDGIPVLLIDAAHRSGTPAR
jgi:uncharacterized protein YbaR (Trm112 family)